MQALQQLLGRSRQAWTPYSDTVVPAGGTGPCWMLCCLLLKRWPGPHQVGVRGRACVRVVLGSMCEQQAGSGTGAGSQYCDDKHCFARALHEGLPQVPEKLCKKLRRQLQLELLPHGAWRLVST